jgi:cellobiose phosphorylase
VRTTTVTGIEHPGAGVARQAIANRYGRFNADGSEYVITDPHTPRPWVNIIANPRFGLAVSQNGGGFTFVDNSQLAMITRWQQDLVLDSSGKFLYVRDADDDGLWSLSPAPLWPAYARFACRHGLGYTVFETRHAGIEACWTVFCHPRETAELWLVELANLSNRRRTLEICPYLEWNCGVAPSPRREFTKLFIETSFAPERAAVFARNHMWEVPSARYGHWNTDFPYVAALASTEPVVAAQGDKTEFLGRYGTPRLPAALHGEAAWVPTFGRHGDPIAALRSRVDVGPGEKRVLGYVLGVGATDQDIDGLLARTANVAAISQALGEAHGAWRDRLAAHRISTPEPSFNAIVNDWVRYQAISSRLWARCGYYQQSGALGFRDQLQDAHVWLTIEPARCREQIDLHAAHQFNDGSVVHWWHPLSEQGHTTRMTDDLLWLAFVTASYLKETGDFTILADAVAFLDDPSPKPLGEHILRAFHRAFSRTSARGLPYIGAGDWNDGLSAVGLAERGESVWLAFFLAGLLEDWAVVLRRTGATERALEFAERRASLVHAVNAHGWDGEWYLRATLDDGSPLGSAANAAGKIFLNAQTWAVLSGAAPAERAATCMAAVREHLVSPAGALLLAPAFAGPVPEIGYITRYAPGMRENGGVYTHAAVWAIAAACKVRDHDLVGRLLAAINPALKEPDHYWAEPYVLPGNVDGPASPHHGRAGWTWYTGSAAWLHRVVCEWVLGIRPEWDGLRVDPCLPPGWQKASMVRPYRGATFTVNIERSPGHPDGAPPRVVMDGVELPHPLLPGSPEPGAVHHVEVRCR